MKTLYRITGLVALVLTTGNLLALDVEDLLKQLQFGTRDQRRIAARELGDTGEAQAVKPLIDCFTVDDPILPSVAATALGKLGPVATPALLEASTNKNAQIKGWATEALARGGKNSLPQLKEMLQSGDVQQQKTAIYALQELKDTTAMAALQELQLAINPEIRYIAAIALDRMGYTAEPFTNLVTHLIAKKDWEALAKLDSKAEPLLIHWLNEPNIRGDVANTIGEIKGENAITVLAKTLEDTADPQVGMPLLKFGIAGQTALARATESTKAEVRKVACLVLAQTVDKTLLTTGKASWALVAVMLQDKDPEVRLEATRALTYYTGPEVVENLVTALSDRNDQVKDSAKYAMSMRIADYAMQNYESFEKLLTHPSAQARALACETLSAHPDKRAKTKLLTLIEDTETDVRDKAILALSKLKDPEIADRLITLAKNSTEMDFYVLSAIADMHDSRSYDIILPYTESSDNKNPLQQSIALRLLGVTNDRRAVAKLLAVYNQTKITSTYLPPDASQELRACKSLVCQGAIEGLGALYKQNIGGDEVKKAILEAYQDGDAGVRAAAKEAFKADEGFL